MPRASTGPNTTRCAGPSGGCVGAYSTSLHFKWNQPHRSTVREGRSGTMADTRPNSWVWGVEGCGGTSRQRPMDVPQEPADGSAWTQDRAENPPCSADRRPGGPPNGPSAALRDDRRTLRGAEWRTVSDRPEAHPAAAHGCARSRHRRRARSRPAGGPSQRSRTGCRRSAPAPRGHRAHRARWRT
jgi:hypothetical protein